MKMKQLGAKGFSLVELMVVVAIIGILAAVAIPQYQNFQSKARMAEGQSMLGAIYSAESAFQGQWNQYFSGLRDVGFAPRGNLNFHSGLGAGGVAAPADTNYPGPSPAGGAHLAGTNTTQGLPNVVGTARACAPVGAVAAAAAAFTAAACGNIDSDGATDQWTLTQDKVFAHPSNDLIL